MRATMAAVVLALLLFAPALAGAMDAQAVFAKAKDSVVVVVGMNAYNKPEKFGSGFIVGDGRLVVTNYHVVDGASGIKIKTGDGTIMDVDEIRAVDRTHDLALLEVSRRGPALELAPGLPAVGQDIVAIGNPVGLERTLSTGVVSGIRKFDPFGRGTRIQVYQITAPISRGSSGGPVLDDQGRVLGVSTFLMDGGQNLNFAIPAMRVGRLMGQRVNKSVPLQPQKSLGIEKDESGAIHIFDTTK